MNTPTWTKIAYDDESTWPEDGFVIWLEDGLTDCGNFKREWFDPFGDYPHDIFWTQAIGYKNEEDEPDDWVLTSQVKTALKGFDTP